VIRVLLTVMLALAAGGQAFAQSRQQAEQKLDSLKDQLETRRARLDTLGLSEGNLLGKLQELEETIDLNTTVVERLHTREERVGREIVLADSSLAQQQARLAETREHYQRRLLAVSKNSVRRPPDWLFLLSDPGQAVLSAPMLRTVGKADRWLIAQYDSLRTDVEKSRLALLDRQAELSRLTQDKLRETSLLEASHQKREGQLKAIRNEKSQLTSAMQELIDAAARLEAVIQDIVESGAATFGGDGRQVLKAKGRLPWPVKGRILEPFGYREVGPKRAKIPHNGLSIEAKLGTPVAAVADGAVSYTGRLRGYGQIVILDHGGGYFTLYGHLNEVDCFKGQLLLQGDPIGTVGDSGSLSGPQLYFELREDRVQVDPLPWLKH
jgi:septal ring factor EnvC (AmiA/AmiB activator)